jgi:hypothetical protein
MPSSPSIVPADTDCVLEDFGLHGQAWRETNDAESDRRTLIEDMLDGQYEDVVRIIAFTLPKAGPGT